ncbi:hypothetical protein K1719_025027 [Acacia pycnantha]|nr:hypothetical protein K1719_025027 [Acacia pycnantha]
MESIACGSMLMTSLTVLTATLSPGQKFASYGYVPSGTPGATIAQIRRAPKGKGATTLMLNIDHGNLWYYNGVMVVENLYDKWFRLNMIHDVDAETVSVFINGDQRTSFKAKIEEKLLTSTSNVAYMLLLVISAII